MLSFEIFTVIDAEGYAHTGGRESERRRDWASVSGPFCLQGQSI